MSYFSQKAKSVPYDAPKEGEQILELIAKCTSYENTLEKVNEESNRLKEQVADLQEVCPCDEHCKVTC